MYTFKTFQKLYNGDYGWIIEEYGSTNDTLSEEFLLTETTMNGYELYKRFDTALDLSTDEGSGWKTEENKLIDDYNGEIATAIKNIAKDFPEEERGYDEQSFKGDSTPNFVNAVDTYLKDGTAWKKFTVKVDGKVTQIKFNQLSKTNSLMGGISAAERTARQECAAALALMMASDFAKNPIPEKAPFKSSELGTIDRQGMFKEKPNGIKKLKEYFTNMKKSDKGFAKRVNDLEGLMGGKTFINIAEFFVLDSSWIKVIHNTARTANKSMDFDETIRSNDRYDVHRGTKFMNLVYSTYKTLARLSGIDNNIIKDDKWNPGDVWMVKQQDTVFITDILNRLIDGRGKVIKPSKDEIRIKELVDGIKGDTPLNYYNALIRKWYNIGVLKGISLKRFGGDTAEVEDYNDVPENDIMNIKVEFDDFRVNNNDPLATKDVYIDFDVEDGSKKPSKEHRYAMQLRSFASKAQAIQGEIKGTHANHGKVGMGVIRYLLGIKEGSRDTEFNEWRRMLNNIYKKAQISKGMKKRDLDAIDVASMGRSSIAKINDIPTDRQGALRILLVNRILKLYNYVFPSANVKRTMSKKDIMDEKKLPIDRTVSKLQALELCAWLRYLEMERKKTKIVVDGIEVFNGRTIDAIMLRIYFYASSRGNIETGARASKFMKIG